MVHLIGCLPPTEWGPGFSEQVFSVLYADISQMGSIVVVSFMYWPHFSMSMVFG